MLVALSRDANGQHGGRFGGMVLCIPAKYLYHTMACLWAMAGRVPVPRHTGDTANGSALIPLL